MDSVWNNVLLDLMVLIKFVIIVLLDVNLVVINTLVINAGRVISNQTMNNAKQDAWQVFIFPMEIASSAHKDVISVLVLYNVLHARIKII